MPRDSGSSPEEPLLFFLLFLFFSGSPHILAPPYILGIFNTAMPSKLGSSSFLPSLKKKRERTRLWLNYTPLLGLGDYPRGRSKTSSVEFLLQIKFKKNTMRFAVWIFCSPVTKNEMTNNWRPVEFTPNLVPHGTLKVKRVLRQGYTIPLIHFWSSSSTKNISVRIIIQIFWNKKGGMVITYNNF